MVVTKFVLKSICIVALKLLSIVVFLLTILASYAGHVNPELWALPSILALTLPYLACATIFLSIVWVLLRKIIFTVLGVITILICLPAMGEVFPVSFEKKAEPGEKTFSLLTWNILHTNDQEYPDSVSNRAIDYIIGSGADIVCIQELEYIGKPEIKGWNEQISDQLQKLYPYRAGEHKSELKILSKYPLKTLIPVNFQEYLDVEVDIHGFKLHLLNLHLTSYALTSENKKILEEIRGTRSAKESVKEFKATVLEKLKAAFRLRARNAEEVRDIINDTPGNLIVCGDFNDVPTSWTYRTIRGEDLKDAYAETSFGPTFTYNANRLYFHIDQILYRGDLKALSVKKGKIKSSDHYPQLVTFAITDATN